MKLLIIGCVLCVVVCCSSQNTMMKIGSNPTTLNTSAVLEIESTNKGFLLPRMTIVQIRAIANPAEGLLVYDTDNRCVKVYQNSSWSGCFQYLSKPTFTLNCSSASWSGKPLSAEPFTGFITIPYTEGGGFKIPSQTITPTGIGVGSLSASLAASTLAIGAGDLTLNLTGTVSSSGVATFAIQVLESSCVVSLKIGSRLGDPEDFAQDNLGATASTIVNGTAVSTVSEAMFGEYYPWAFKSSIGTYDKKKSINWSISTSTWEGSIKLENDPCPDGYKVPTVNQLYYLSNKDATGKDKNNGITISRIGGWNQLSPSAVKFEKNGKVLLLPAAGFYQTSGDVKALVVYKELYYWSSTPYPGYPDFAYGFKANESTIIMSSLSRGAAMPIRCILIE